MGTAFFLASLRMSVPESLNELLAFSTRLLYSDDCRENSKRDKSFGECSVRLSQNKVKFQRVFLLVPLSRKSGNESHAVADIYGTRYVTKSSFYFLWQEANARAEPRRGDADDMQASRILFVHAPLGSEYNWIWNRESVSRIHSKSNPRFLLIEPH